MQSQFANAAVKTFFVLSSATLLASCASTQRAEEFAVNPVVAPKATVETLQKIDTSTESAGISEEQNLSSPDIRFSSNPTLSQVLKRAYDNHPDIRAAGFEHKARQAEVRQASRRPNPEITTELENFAGNGCIICVLCVCAFFFRVGKVCFLCFILFCRNTCCPHTRF